MAEIAGNVREERSSSKASIRFQRIHEILRARICLLEYPPGTRLSEEALANEFGVSRTPLRRVLGRLESERLVKSVQGVGTIVTDVDINELIQVYQLRLELAEFIGKLSPVPASRETIAAFRSLAERSRKLVRVPDPRKFAELNMEFFHALMKLTSSDPLRDISERLYYRTTRIWLKSIWDMNLAEEIQIFSREVADVLVAVELGDLEAVGHIRRSHISMSFTRLKNHAARLNSHVSS